MARRFPGGSSILAEWMGGAPNPAPELGHEAREAGWALPPSLERFYGVHDGLGPEGSAFGTECIEPAGQLAPLNEEHPYRLAVYCDSVGNRQVLMRSESDAEPSTHDWDHETHQLATGQTFFEFLDQTISMQIMDLDPYDNPDWLE